MGHLDTSLVRDYLERRNREPLLGFHVGEYYPLRQFPAATMLPQGPFTVDDLPVEPYLADAERMVAEHAGCPGNLVYCPTAFTGVPWIEAALGCPVVADHGTGSSRSLPAVGPDGWPLVPEFSPDNPWVGRCLAMTRALGVQGAGRYPLGTTLLRGVADALAALLGLERLVFEMIDNPVRVHALASRVAAYWAAFAAALLDEIPPYEGGTGTLYQLWLPGRAVTLQEDNAALLSPRLYDAFIRPHDMAIAAAFERSVFHMHPARYIPYRALLDSPVDVVELHIDRGGPTARDLLTVYREILVARPLLVWGDLSAEDIAVLRGEIGPEGLALVPVVASVEEAWALAGA